METRKYENRNETINIDVLKICEMRWSEQGDFLCDSYRV